jgi:hypothetical protein
MPASESWSHARLEWGDPRKDTTMIDIAMFAGPRPAPNVKALVKMIADRYAIADAYTPEQAKGTVRYILYCILSGKFDWWLGDGTDREPTAYAVRQWDSEQSVRQIVSVMTAAHYRTPSLLIDQILARAVAKSRNEIFLEASEVVKMIGITCAIGNEMRRVLPETVDIWLQEET